MNTLRRIAFAVAALAQFVALIAVIAAMVLDRVSPWWEASLVAIALALGSLNCTRRAAHHRKETPND